MKRILNLVIHNRNTKSFKKSLEKFDIYPHPCGFLTEDPSADLFINRGFYSNQPIGYGDEKMIDCKDCKELVLDLLSYDETTDKNQWFMFDNTDVFGESGCKEMFKCRNKSIEVEMCYDMLFIYCTRASVEQIVEYYLTKDKDGC